MFINQADKSKLHKSELTSIAEGAGITFVGQAVESLVKYLYIITVARLLGAESLGLLVLGLTVVGVTGMICRMGLENGVIRYVALYNGINDKGRVKGVIVESLKYSFVVSTVIAFILYLIAGSLFTRIFDKPEIENVIKLLSLSLPFLSLLLIGISSTCGFKVMHYRTLGQCIFLPLSNLLLAVFFFLLGFGLRGIVFAYVISVFLTSILSIYFVGKVFPDIVHVRAVLEVGKLLRFSIPLLIVSFLNYLIIWTDTLMLGYFKTSENVGIYNVAMRSALLTSMILVSFNVIFAPIISDLYNRKEKHKLEILFKTVTKWVYTMSFPVFFLIALMPKEIMAIFGREFVIGWIPLVILAFAQFVNAAAGPAGFMLGMSGKQYLMTYNTIGIFLLNIFLNGIFIPRYGMAGAAMASGTSIIVFNLVMLMEVYLLWKIHPYNAKFLTPTFFGMVAFGVGLFTRIAVRNLETIQGILIYVPLFLAVYVLSICRWGIDNEDRFIVEVFRMKFLKIMKKA